MFNVTIINAKGSIKKIAILIVTLILLFIVTRFIQNLKSTEVFKINLSSKLVNCLNNEIPAINEIVSKSNTTIKEEISTPVSLSAFLYSASHSFENNGCL